MRLRLVVLTPEQLETVYYVHMTEDFPPDERKPLGMITMRVAEGGYTCYGLRDGSTLVGYAFCMRAETDGIAAYLLDYFAIFPDRRGRGYGSACLKLLTAQLTDAQMLLIETEHPDAAPDDRARAVRQRRERFYLRSGCMDSGVTALVFGVRYRLLTLSASGVQEPAFVRAVYETLYREMLPPEMYRQNIVID